MTAIYKGFKNIFSGRKKSIGTHPSSAEELLGARGRDKVSEIYRLSRVNDGSFDLLYRPVLQAMAEHVQLLPASESHHHAYAGGLLDHILETAHYALRIRSGMQLPVGETPETIRVKSDLCTYAVFVAAIMHDIGKPVVDVEVMMLDSKGEELGFWNPYGDSLSILKPNSYTFRFCRGRRYQLHSAVASIMLAKIVPSEGINWIASDKKLYSEFLHYIQGGQEGVISDIVSKADQTSVSKALGGNNVQEISGVGLKTKQTLADKIKWALKLTVENPKNKFNGKGSLGWFDGEYCWFMSKTLIDELREQFKSDGITGVPGNNKRLFDVMVENGIVVPNNGKAIWKARIELDDWKPKEFTMLKIHHSLLWSDESLLNPFSGSIIPSDEQIQEKSKDSDVSLDALLKLEGSEKPSTDLSSKSSSDGKSVEGHSDSKNTQATDVGDDLASIFMTDPQPSKGGDHSDETKEMGATGNDTANDIAPPSFDGEADPGTSFLFWLRRGIRNKEIRYNGSEYQVHIIEAGIFLVSPAIFMAYGVETKQDWKLVQKSFQKLRINIKNAKGENWHKVRVSGERDTSTLTGWLVPKDEVFEVGQKVSVNSHLTLLK